MNIVMRNLKIAGALLAAMLLVLLIVPDPSTFPAWPPDRSERARIVETARPAAPVPQPEPSTPDRRVVEPAPAPTLVPVAPPPAAQAARTEGASPGEPGPTQANGGRTFFRPVAATATSFEADGMFIHLEGLEPIGAQARCASGASTVPCGAQARTALRGWLRGRSIQCDIPPDAQAGQTITTRCTLGGEDVARWLVRQGWAKPEQAGPYQADAEAAERAQRGLWRVGDILD